MHQWQINIQKRRERREAKRKPSPAQFNNQVRALLPSVQISMPIKMPDPSTYRAVPLTGRNLTGLSQTYG